MRPEGDDLATEELTHTISKLEHLDRAAMQAANAGQWSEAERLWTEARALSPLHRNALWGLGYAALHRGDAGYARILLTTAQREHPKDKIILMALARACRDCADVEGEGRALQTVLELDPQDLPAMLAMASLFDRVGHANTIAAYTSALEHAPVRQEDWPDECRTQLLRAKVVVDRHKQTLFKSLTEKLDNVGERMSPEARGRWREAASIMAKITTPYNPQCHSFFVPRLPSQPFYDTAQFPWVKALEAKTDIIRDELVRALEVRGEGFVPYVTLDRGGTEQEWKELNQSTRWSVLYLWRNGLRDAENQKLCPETVKALDLVDQAHIHGNCPNAMFSALAPRTRIPPHSGESNARLVVHLPLIVPEKCGALRVGFEEREWKVGQALIFDDSIEHEAWNDSDELRVVLLFDVWHPQLTSDDREMVNALVGAEADFRGQRGAANAPR